MPSLGRSVSSLVSVVLTVKAGHGLRTEEPERALVKLVAGDGEGNIV